MEDIDLDLERKIRFSKLTEEQQNLVKRMYFVDFLECIKKTMPNCINELLRFSGSLEIYELEKREKWNRYENVIDEISTEVIRILSLRYLENEMLQKFFFDMFLPMFPNVKKIVDFCKKNKLMDENEMLFQPSKNAASKEYYKKVKALSKLDSMIQIAKPEENCLLGLYAAYIDKEQKSVLRMTYEEYHTLSSAMEEGFLGYDMHDSFYEVIKEFPNLDEKLINDYEFWKDTWSKYGNIRAKAIEDYYGKSLMEIMKEKFLTPMQENLPADLNISYLLNRLGYPDKAFFSKEIFDYCWTTEELLEITYVYYKNKFLGHIASFNEIDGLENSLITKHTIKKYVLSLETNEINPISDASDIFKLMCVNTCIRLIGSLNCSTIKMITDDICNKKNNSSKAMNSLNKILEKNNSLQNLVQLHKEENKQLKMQIAETISKENQDKSFAKELVESNKQLNVKLQEKEKEIAALEQKIAQYNEYLAMLEQEEYADEKIDVDNEKMQKWFIDKKIMFFMHGSGEYIDNLKKMFPNCVIVDKATQSIEGVIADVTVAMTKNLSHKLFFKQKAYCRDTSTKLVYFNGRNLDGLKEKIFKECQ